MIRIFVLLAAVLFISYGQAQSADTLFSDDFSGTSINGTRWVLPATTAGMDVVLNNGALVFKTTSGNSLVPQSAWLSSQTFEAPDYWSKVNFNGYWGSSNLNTTSMSLYIYDSNTPSKYLEVVRSNTGVTFIDSLKTNPVAYIDKTFTSGGFSFRFSRVGWDFYEGTFVQGSPLEHIETDTMASSKFFNLKIGGSDATTSAFRAFGFDNIDVKGSVVPEPVSMLLFGIGGATLGLSRRLKKRRGKKEEV